MVNSSSFSSVRTEALAKLFHCYYALHSSNGLIPLSRLLKLVLARSCNTSVFTWLWSLLSCLSANLWISCLIVVFWTIIMCQNTPGFTWDSFKKSFTIIFQMLLCADCYGNVYTSRRRNCPSLLYLRSHTDYIHCPSHSHLYHYKVN
jgi:hypothetical protein